MSNRLQTRTTPSMAIAILALFIALSGTAVAASRYIITSSSQIKPGAIALQNISLGARVSLKGSAGPPGPAGTNALANTTVYSHSAPVPANQYFYYFVLCPSGERAISGGATTSSSFAVINESFPIDTNGNPVTDNGALAAGWRTQVYNSGGTQLQVTYYAMCA